MHWSCLWYTEKWLHNAVYMLITGICKYILLHSKKELKLKTEVKFLIIWPWDGNIFLDYSGGPNVIQRSLWVKEGKKMDLEWYSTRETWLVIAGLDDGMELQNKQWEQLLEARKEKEIDSTLESSEGIQLYCHLDFSSVKFTSDFWPLEL